MSKIILLVMLFLLTGVPLSRSQSLSGMKLNDTKLKYSPLFDKLYDDTSVVINGKNKVQTVYIGGIFISPNIGVAFPLGEFNGSAGTGIIFGAKLEFAFSRLYPFVFGFVYEGQNFKGNSGFINNNLLTSFTTDVTYIGGSIDVILNKFIKSNFTTPVLSAEVKYASVKRNIQPDVTIPGIVPEQSLLTYSAGLAFTIYIFDINTKYTYAAEYSNLNFQLRFHFPLIKF